nr:RNA-directed DNA polymerase, eukaryota [Tanacetum cinerariifolium]
MGISSDSFKRNVGNYSNSFASVLKSGKPVTETTRWEVPYLVLDDTCFSDRDFNLSLIGKVNDITALPNLYVILEEEESDGNSKEGELKYPPGFTSKETSVNEVHEKEMEAPSEEVKQNSYNSVRNNSLNASYCSQRWDGECMIMGDFNEVRSEHERYGLVFNVQSAAAFNNFISLASLIDLPLDGYAYTWEMAQKAKVRWAIEGDENSKYFHGILNNKRSHLAIRVAVMEFFSSGTFPKGCNSSFIDLIPKTQNAKTVKDFCPISLIRSLYKIIAKILANRLSSVIPDLISDVESTFISNRQILDGPFILNELFSWCKYKKLKAMVFKVDFEKAFDSKRWDYLDIILKSFGFGDKWRGQSSLGNGMNLKIILKVLKCFHMASGFKININKSKLMGYGMHSDEVETAARYIGCATFVTPFSHLGVKVGGRMERINSWDDVVSKVTSRLSK